MKTFHVAIRLNGTRFADCTDSLVVYGIEQETPLFAMIESLKIIGTFDHEYPNLDDIYAASKSEYHKAQASIFTHDGKAQAMYVLPPKLFLNVQRVDLDNLPPNAVRVQNDQGFDYCAKCGGEMRKI